jgi:hypothetical protein
MKRTRRDFGFLFMAGEGTIRLSFFLGLNLH